ncbi:MAG TPA: MFS transporter, partial [Algoriphagus sp.]|nr:MFS transporter [Algoriphagus sp.]
MRPIPFLIGFGIALLGLYLSFFFLKDTTRFISVEKTDSKKEEKNNVFWNTTFRRPNLSSITQAGLVNNLNDGMIWGLLPLLLIQKEFSLNEIGKLIAIYPLVWGMGQLFSGKI